MTATPTKPTLNVLLIADSDSQLLACKALCSAPTTLNVNWTINVIPRDGTPRHYWNVWPSWPACATKAWLGCCAIGGSRALTRLACF